jgi:hypothetical protein
MCRSLQSQILEMGKIFTLYTFFSVFLSVYSVVLQKKNIKDNRQTNNYFDKIFRYIL